MKSKRDGPREAAREHVKLLNRVKRVRGQLDAVERSLNAGAECADILMLLAASKGAINALMAEILEDHIRLHLLPGRSGSPSKEASQDLASDLIDIVHAYFK